MKNKEKINIFLERARELKAPDFFVENSLKSIFEESPTPRVYLRNFVVMGRILRETTFKIGVLAFVTSIFFFINKTQNSVGINSNLSKSEVSIELKKINYNNDNISKIDEEDKVIVFLKK